MPQEIRAVPANVVDHKLLMNAANMSPVELSAEVNGILRPEVAAARVKELLRARDWLTDTELDNLVTYKLQKALARLEGQYLDNENLELQLKFLREIAGRLDKRRAATTVDLNTLYGNNGRLMAQIYDMCLAYMKGALREKIDADLWDELAQEALDHASLEISRHEAIEA